MKKVNCRICNLEMEVTEKAFATCPESNGWVCPSCCGEECKECEKGENI